MPIDLIVNGTRRRLDADPQRSLLTVLREDLDLTGAKYGCGEGQCGACTVLIEGQPTRSCLTKLGALAGKSVTTIEGLETGGQLHPLQQAFLDAGAVQCGFCTSGMLLTARALLRENSTPSRDDVLHYLRGSLCRCTGYRKIVEAIMTVAEARR